MMNPNDEEYFAQIYRRLIQSETKRLESIENLLEQACQAENTQAIRLFESMKERLNINLKELDRAKKLPQTKTSSSYVQPQTVFLETKKVSKL